MTTVKKYFRSVSDECDSGINCVPVLSVTCGSAEELEDDESIAASAYLNYVRQEASKLPFAIEATNIHTSAGVLESSGPVDSALPFDSQLAASIVDYFMSVRELVRSNSGDKREVLIEVVSGNSDCSLLAVADFASIAAGLEEFADGVELVDIGTAAEWIFAFLVYLDFPLLEDTAAALQILNRFIHEHSDCRKLMISGVVIREYFNQR